MPLDPQNLVVHIEIPQSSNIKYELDEENGKFMIDRIMPTTMGYPENYGLIEGTHGQDGDALDVLVFASQALTPNCHIKCKVIGLLEMEDEAGIDHKILAVPLPKIDMICGQWNSVDGEYFGCGHCKSRYCKYYSHQSCSRRRNLKCNWPQYHPA